jgi:DNA-binding MltR family transcriptional regulator
MNHYYYVNPDQDFRDILHNRVNITNESDRGIVLIAANDIEENLEKLLNKFIGDRISTPIRKDIFDHKGALGSLSNKAKISLAVGLIDKKIYDEIELVRRIRNNVAHNSIEFSFDSKETLQILNSLVRFKPLKDGWIENGFAEKFSNINSVPTGYISLNKFCFIQLVQMLNIVFMYDVEYMDKPKEITYTNKDPSEIQ